MWAPTGGADHFTIEQAREKAREAIKRIRARQPPFEVLPPNSESFEAVTREYLIRHVAGNGHLTARETKRIFEQYVLPSWPTREFVSIKKNDVAKLLDAVEGEHCHRCQADRALAAIRGLMHWQQSRMDDYICPISDALRRTDPKTRKRDRILSNDEIRDLAAARRSRDLWVAFLTAQRPQKIVTMKWANLSDDGIWTVPHAHREKGVGGALALPELALQVIRTQPPPRPATSMST